MDGTGRDEMIAPYDWSSGTIKEVPESLNSSGRIGRIGPGMGNWSKDYANDDVTAASAAKHHERQIISKCVAAQRRKTAEIG